MTAIIIYLIIPCMISGCSAKVSLDEETLARLDEDATHAEEDAPFVRTNYYGEWEGEFIVNGKAPNRYVNEVLIYKYKTNKDSLKKYQFFNTMKIQVCDEKRF